MFKVDAIIPQEQQAIWLNKNEQQHVFATKERAGNGSLLVENFVMPIGHPILIGTKQGVMARADFEALQQHNKTTITPFELTLYSETWTVIWDNTEGPAITGTDVFDEVGGYSSVEQVTLKFLTAEA